MNAPVDDEGDLRLIVAELTRARDAALAREAALVEVLDLINRSPADPGLVFELILEKAHTLCEAAIGALSIYDGTLMHTLAMRGFADDYEARMREPWPPPEVTTRRLIDGADVVHIPDSAVIGQGFGFMTGRSDMRTTLVVPLRKDNAFLGQITAFRADVRPFSDEQIALLRRFGDLATLAIENARLLEALRGRTDELARRNTEYSERIDHQAATIDVLQAMSASPGDPQPVFDLIATRARDLCDAYGSTVYEFDGTHIHWRAATGVSDDPAVRAAYEAQFPMVPTRAWHFGRAILDRRITRIDDMESEPGLNPTLRGITAKSNVTIPIMRGDAVIGAVAMGSRKIGGFSDSQIELLKTFAEQASIAITSAETYRALRERTADLQESLEYQIATSDVLKAISRSTFDLQPVLDTLVTTAARLCQAENAFLLERDRDMFRAKATFAVSPVEAAMLQGLSLKMDRGTITGRAALEGRAVQIKDVTTDPDYALAQTVSVARNRTLLGVPLLRQGVVVGVFALGRQHVESFTDQQIALVSTFADQAVIAIENTRLLTETREALEQQTATAEVLQVINASPGNLQPVFDTMLEKAHGLCDAPLGALVTWDGAHMRAVATHGFPDSYAARLRRPFPPSRASQSLLDGARLFHVDDAMNDVPDPRAQGVQETGARTALLIPLRKDGAFLGYISSFRKEVRPFSDKEIALLENFAAQAVIAMENVRLLTETREALEQQTATAELLRTINESPGNPQPVFDAMLEKAMHLCGVAFGFLVTWDGTVRRVVAVRGLSPAVKEYAETRMALTPSPGIQHLFATRRPHQILDLMNDDGYRNGHPDSRMIVDIGGVRSCLHVPLVKDDTVVGNFSFYRRDVREFSGKEIALLENFAAQAVIAMENARLLGELRERTGELAERNTAFAERIDHQAATIDVLKEMSASPADAQPVFDLICDQARALLGTPAVTLFEYDGRLVHLRARSLSASFSNPTAITAYSADWPRIPDRGSLSCRAILDRTVIHVRDMDAEPGVSPEVRALGSKTQVVIPLMRDGRAIGAISTGNTRIDGISDTQIELLKTFAEQAVIAIQGAETWRALQDRTAELAERNAAFAERIDHQAATIDVLKEMSNSPGDAQPVFDLICRQAKALLDTVAVTLFEYDGRLVHLRATHGTDENFDAAAIDAYRNAFPMVPDHGSLTCRAILDGTTIHIRDLTAEPGLSPAVRALGHRTQVTIPLLRDGKAIGAITTSSFRVDGVTDTQIDLLRTFAEQAVIAITSAENHRALRQSLEHQDATIDVLKVISTSTGDTQPVFDTILSQAMRLCGCMFGGLVEFDGELMHLRATAGWETETIAPYARQFPMPPTRANGYGRAILDRAVRYVRDILQDPEIPPVTIALGHRSQVNVPLMRGGTAIGAIAVGHKDVDALSEAQIGLLKTFAEQAVIAIGGAETFRALQERTAALAQRNSEFGERIEQQAATIDVLKVMSSTPDDTQPVFDQISRRAQELCNSTSAGVMEYRDGLVHVGGIFSVGDVQIPAVSSYLAQFPKAPTRDSPVCRSILEGQIIHIKNMGDVLDVFPAARSMVESGFYRSLLVIPLLRDGQSIGCVWLSATERGGFTDSQVALLQTFAEQAVIAIGSVATFRALRERTNELARRQNELRVTFENMGDGVAMFDETQQLVAWNRRFQALLDVPDEVIAHRRTFPDYIRYLAERGEYGPDADPEEQIRRLSETVGQHRAYERTRPNGTVIEIRNNPVASGGFVVIYADITERKRAETAIRAARDAAESALRDLQTAQDRLIQAEKMASLGQLTAGIAHEIKNPLNFVNNFASLSVELLDELKETAAPAFATLNGDARADVEDLTETLTGNLKKIEEHGKRADGIVRSMLEHSRGSSGEQRAVDLNELVDEALNLAFHGARARDQSFNITLEREFSTPIAPIEVNPQDLTRVFLNLFSNGFYAANKRAKDEAGEAVLKASTRDLGHAVEIRVRDNGTGIPEEIRDKLFQPFFTTKPTGEGTGLGLSITYDIVTKQHRGTIAVASQVGSFTEFIVTIPRQPRLDGGAP